MIQSILDSIKKSLNIDPAVQAFDEDIMLHINAVFGTLNQLGVGPQEGFRVESATTEWDSYFGGDSNLNEVKTYVFLRVRLLFDPPTMSFLIASMEKQITELEWRLNTKREESAWIDPALTPAREIDGGTV